MKASLCELRNINSKINSLTISINETIQKWWDNNYPTESL